ncbi:DUF2949 domain-containing protein [Leptolyngbya sp. FACHB-261]|uniref:DUF2949 domain-containing protein n=1 Tax=Leptolyngbya sp. FACHB-261 TaxID=2692806 RepID=UPI001688667C|nr:DUF2949 domain-containing protein [Leptolyngbya sp. FACHB-261]MBD2100318.1 DUF2949 domain-containing protein [Leptolyngbya sp. FACHB-261]
MELSRSKAQLVSFLQQELTLPPSSIALALRHWEQDPGPLSMILWQYGLVSLEQLEKIFDWLEMSEHEDIGQPVTVPIS